MPLEVLHDHACNFHQVCLMQNRLRRVKKKSCRLALDLWVWVKSLLGPTAQADRPTAQPNHSCLGKSYLVSLEIIYGQEIISDPAWEIVPGHGGRLFKGKVGLGWRPTTPKPVWPLPYPAQTAV